MKQLALVVLCILLGTGLVACGQKGGLTRPEPATFTVAFS